MQSDEYGFLYPVVNEVLCVECGLCTKVCPLKQCQIEEEHSSPNTDFTQRYFAFSLDSKSELLKSQSGGAFYQISNTFLSQGTTVYGAVFDEGFNVLHIGSTDVQGRDRMRGSKYVQSDLRGVFDNIRQELQEDRTVLFSGTPCQVAGLVSFLPHKLRKNLFLVDLVCNGVASPKMWNDYICYLEGIYGGKIEMVKFRDKKDGWSSSRETYVINGREYRRRTFMNLYHKRLMRRDCCGKCPFASYSRFGDVTIGDFWGWERLSSIENDNTGISLVMVNTAKGGELLDLLRSGGRLLECSKSDCVQPMLLGAVKFSPESLQFNKDYVDKGFKYVAEKYGDLSLKYTLRAFLYRIYSKVKTLVSK